MIWVGLGNERETMNITIFQGWRVVVKIPVDEWDDCVHSPEDVKRAAMVCMGRQLLGEHCPSVGIEAAYDLGEPLDANLDLHYEEQHGQESGPEEELEAKPAEGLGVDFGFEDDGLLRPRPVAPEPYTPEQTADHGHDAVFTPLVLSDNEGSEASPTCPAPFFSPLPPQQQPAYQVAISPSPSPLLYRDSLWRRIKLRLRVAPLVGTLVRICRWRRASPVHL